MDYSRDINSLDKIRIENGSQQLESYFEELLDNNAEEAIKEINDKNLQFTTLFILKPKIEKLDLVSQLSLRNKLALNITNEILDDNNSNYTIKPSSSKYMQLANSTLRWMLETSANDDGLKEDLDEVLDVTAILLIKVYKDTEVLPLIRDMIFERNKKGLFTHDLVWAFFESKDPNCLFLIGDKLNSNDTKEVVLACNLLNFIPGIDLKLASNKESLYLTFIHWFEENSSFLYYTGESFQQTSNPIPYSVDLESKYLCKISSKAKGKKFSQLTTNQLHQLTAFNNLDISIKTFLANFSYKTRKRNVHWWNSWLQKPINEQIKIARTRGGMI